MEAGGESRVRIDLDNLPIKRLEAIDEIGNEQFPPDTSSEEQRLSKIRRIDFSWVVEKDAKKKKDTKDQQPPQQQAWPWLALVENLQQAQQELSVIIDLINTVEANNAVAVTGMQRPKQLPNETLADLAVCAATKLQEQRHLARYFKQCSKIQEKQVLKEARFYGSVIRLQRNWKIKRLRLGGSGPGNEGFTFDIIDNSQSDTAAMSRPSPLCLVHVDQDSSGTLAIQVPQKSCCSLHLKTRGDNSSCIESYMGKKKKCTSSIIPPANIKDSLKDDDVNKFIKHTNSTLRDIHMSIFEEQVFDMVNRETYDQSQGINVTGIREDFLQLAIGQECSLCLCLALSGKEADFEGVDHMGHSYMKESEPLSLTLVATDENDIFKNGALGIANPLSLEIYLLQFFHENALKKWKERAHNVGHSQVPAQATENCDLLGHFCMTVAHKMFSNRVCLELESLVSRVPYLHLLSFPTWHSRTSSWSLFLKVPQPILHANRPMKPSDNHELKYKIRSQFHTKVVLKDSQITLMGEGSPSIVGSSAGRPSEQLLINSYNCDLEVLPMILLQQVASQVIHWLHEEALALGMNVVRDFLCLYFDLDQGETLGLVAHVDPDDQYGCISWWMVMLDHAMEEGKLPADNLDSENRSFLGYLPLETLYSTLMDLINLGSTGVNH